MAGLIPKDFIQDLVARADIHSVVDSRVRLKKAGRNYQACCPFHSEKSPSFTVAPDKQFYHCFGCGAHGNAIDFVMEYDGLEFPDAVEVLAAELGLEVPRERGAGRAGRDRAEIEDDYNLMERVARFYMQQLRQHGKSAQVIEYLKNRGLTGETAKAFGIGYAPSEWDSVLKGFGGNKAAEQQLLALKLINENDSGRRYDFFRDRLIFPIRDRRGRVVGFGGRVLDNEQGPKYLNSPETRLFHKGRELYGFYEMKQHYKQLEQVVIVEGYMDVVALAQHGVRNAVASLGTAATPEQLQLLFRQSPQVICCFDGDRAGRDAAWRALENALPMLRDGHDLRFLFLPDGDDPDSIVRAEGKEGFLKRLEQAQSLRHYFFEHLSSQYDLSQDAGKGALIAAAKPLIERLQSEFYRELMLEELANRLGRDISQLEQMIAKPTVKMPPQTAKRSRGTPVERAMGMLVQHPELGKMVPVNNTLADLKMENAKVFVALHRQTSGQTLTTAQLLEGWRGTRYEEQLRDLAQWNHEILAAHLEQEFKDTYMFLIDRYLEQRYEELKALPTEQLTKARLRELDQILRALKKSP
ncbi:DNA primase [Aliidiomarina taiwanensis]|uniref:DNA primase n=1 Tax=Aliidiomarina taiwanensis TaxID=946228 RepID=A0A432X1C7_9GAMM|nr:DNA primase [Aliidiomarina taiwanensis]RUO40086.1 DNA primase [Aliidiomarina taiwanensis]